MSGIYIAVNVLYSLGAKHVALLDVFLLSSGFVIRVLLGCALVAAAPSAWLLLCTSSLALFLGFTKRRADSDGGTRQQPSAQPAGLQHDLPGPGHHPLCRRGCCRTPCTASNPRCSKSREMASMPFVAYGILNYLRLANTENAGGSPVEIAFSSRSSQLLRWVGLRP